MQARSSGGGNSGLPSRDWRAGGAESLSEAATAGISTLVPLTYSPLIAWSSFHEKAPLGQDCQVVSLCVFAVCAVRRSGDEFRLAAMRTW